MKSSLWQDLSAWVDAHDTKGISRVKSSSFFESAKYCENAIFQIALDIPETDLFKHLKLAL